MQKKLKNAFLTEIEQGMTLYKKSEWNLAFHHFERAHILGQSYIIPHTQSHFWMLKIGFKQRNFREVIGQVTRIIASIIFSKLWVPLGNTGGSNVNPLTPMPVPEDLKPFLSK